MDQAPELEVGPERGLTRTRRHRASLPRPHTPPEGMASGAAVDHEDMPRDPGGGLGRQEQRRLGDVVGLTQSLQREPGGDSALRAVPTGRGRSRYFTRPGASGVDPDPGTELAGQLPGEVDQRGFGDVVPADPGSTDKPPIDDTLITEPPRSPIDARQAALRPHQEASRLTCTVFSARGRSMSITGRSRGWWRRC